MIISGDEQKKEKTHKIKKQSREYELKARKYRLIRQCHVTKAEMKLLMKSGGKENEKNKTKQKKTRILQIIDKTRF